jgi:prophage antirepressor-like protein
MNNIITFNNDLFGEVRTLVIDEKIYFIGKDIAEALGYKEPHKAISRHCKHGMKHPVLDITGFEQQMNIIPESDVYRLIFGSHLPEAEKFEEWVMEEVLPQLRQCGVYITESATQEAIDYQNKYGIKRIRNTFRETTNLINTWNEFKELSKIERDAHRINNEDRIKRCEIIIDELQNYIANNNLEMKTYEVVMYQEVMLEIKGEITRLSNKRNGGIKSGMTKQINKAEQDKQELRDELEHWKTYAEELEEYYNPEREWITVDFAPFSLNCMYKDEHRTPAYNWWIKNFPRHQIPTREYFESKGIVFAPKSVIVELNFIHPERFDTDNLFKATIDMIFNRCLGVDDKVVAKVIPQTIGTCDSLQDGKIIFTIYNVDDDRI